MEHDMTAKLRIPAAAAEYMGTAEEVQAQYSIPYRTLLALRNAGKIPFVRYTAKTIRYPMRQVGQALGIDVEEAAA